MTVTLYRSTDASAPVLTGSAGALVTVLDAVLVNGYGSQPAAGWTKAFSAANKAAYQNAVPTTGTGFYLNVDDTGGGSGGGREAFMTGFESMSAIGTGSGQFPTSGLLNLGTAPAGAVVCRKSNTADATARAWTILADNTVFYLFAETGDVTSPIEAYPFIFGDIFSYRTSDAYRCLIIGRNAVNTLAGQNDGFSALLSVNSTTFLSSTIIGHYMPRSWTQAGTALIVGKHVDQTKMGGVTGQGSSSGTTALGSAPNCAIGMNTTPSVFPFPNGPDGGLHVSPIWIHHSLAIRGYMKGLWAPLQDRPLNHGDTYSGSGTLSGKTFLAISITTPSIAGQVHLETSNTWG